MKKTLLLLIALIFISSCNTDDVLINPSIVSESEPLETLKFNSNQDVHNKINYILLLKDEKEKNIVDEMFNSHSSTPIDITRKKGLTKDLIDNVKKYHTKKLENIYSIREELGITSIQSIADEINSLKLLNPAKAKELLFVYAEKLNQEKFLVTTKAGFGISEVINSKGELYIGSKVKKYFTESDTQNNKFIAHFDVKEAILTSNNFYAITWHAGYAYFKEGVTLSGGFTNNGTFSPTGGSPSSLFPHQYIPFTKLASWINIGGGYFLYPSRFNLYSGEATFRYSTAMPVTVPFRGYFNGYIAEVNSYGEALNSTNELHISLFKVKKVKIGSGSYNTFTGIPTLNPYLNLNSSSLERNYY